MKTESRGHIITFALLVAISLVVLAFAWLSLSSLATELRSLPATYKLNAAEVNSLVQAARRASLWTFIPLAVVIGAWTITARLFLRAAKQTSTPDE